MQVVSGKKIEIPVLGFGTAEYPLGLSAETMKETILHAIKLGYRHFDTASLYKSEQYLGEAISDALALGLVDSRDQFFITSKLWCSDAHPHLVLHALQKTLKNLKLEYLDLYLVHLPVSMKPSDEQDMPKVKEELVAMDFKSVWEAMEECVELGLTKSIGVSNFSCKKLEIILATAKIPPVVNQVEMNPVWQQKKLREFCKQKDIIVAAYSPLGAKGAHWGTNRVMDSDVIKNIAHAKAKTIAQICLRWAYEQGIVVIVKSFNKERMKENLDIFDWKLTSEELHQMSQISQQKSFLADMFVYNKGPYKSVDEFWDREI